MVKIVADIPPQIYERIVDLVKQKEYDGVAQFVVAACENQLVLGSVPDEPVLDSVEPEIITPVEVVSKKPVQREHKQPSEKKVKASRRMKSRKGRIISFSEAEKVEALKLFACNGSDIVYPASVDPDRELLKEWPWGQANRYLPLKMAVRAVANLSSNGEWPLTSEVIESIKSPAVTIGSILSQADSEQNRKREAVLSTALPRVYPDDARKSEKSQLRFIGSFMCQLSPTGSFYPGGAIYYGLAGRSGEDRIGLTDAGLNFCRLHNPVLDNDPAIANSTLSNEEINWLREHAFNLKGEGEAFSLILDVLGDKRLSPTDFTNAVAGILREDPEGGAFNIQLNGVISRMVELGLIKRIWEGTRAYYVRNT